MDSWVPCTSLGKKCRVLRILRFIKREGDVRTYEDPPVSLEQSIGIGATSNQSRHRLSQHRKVLFSPP